MKLPEVLWNYNESTLNFRRDQHYPLHELNIWQIAWNSAII
jgi:hypothetical protein